MTFRKFFKFTKGKIGLFILLFILIFSFAPCTSIGYILGAGNTHINSGWSICGPLTKMTYLSGQYITDVSQSYFGLIDLAKNIYFILIFELIISYLISCMIIYIYNKLKK